MRKAIGPVFGLVILALVLTPVLFSIACQERKHSGHAEQSKPNGQESDRTQVGNTGPAVAVTERGGVPPADTDLDRREQELAKRRPPAGPGLRGDNEN